MTVPFTPPSITHATSRAALTWAKEWRSDCLDCIGRVEMQIGAILNAMALSPLALGGVKLGQPTRPSLDHLRQKLRAKGHWKTDRRALDEKLGPIQTFFEFRPQVAHGELNVWQDEAGEWLLTLRHAEGSCTGAIHWRAYPFSEAERLRLEIHTESVWFVNEGEKLIARYANSRSSDPADTPSA